MAAETCPAHFEVSSQSGSCDVCAPGWAGQSCGQCKSDSACQQDTSNAQATCSDSYDYSANSRQKVGSQTQVLDMHGPWAMPKGTPMMLCTQLSVTCSTQQWQGPQHAASCTLQQGEAWPACRRLPDNEAEGCSRRDWHCHPAWVLTATTNCADLQVYACDIAGTLLANLLDNSLSFICNTSSNGSSTSGASSDPSTATSNIGAALQGVQGSSGQLGVCSVTVALKGNGAQPISCQSAGCSYQPGSPDVNCGSSNCTCPNGCPGEGALPEGCPCSTSDAYIVKAPQIRRAAR